MSAASAAIVATATAPPDPPPTPIPPQLAAKPRGNPNLHLARRCGARTRAGCPCQAPAIRGRLRCRLLGGRSTGPRIPEGLARIRDARTIHGDHGAWARAKNRYRITLVRRTRVSVAVDRYQDFLHPAFVARLSDYPPELMAAPYPTGGITAAQDRMRRRAVAAALAPWRRAIADARDTARKRAAAAHAADPNTRVRAPRPRPQRPSPAHPTPQALLAGLLSKPHAPEAAILAHGAGAPRPMHHFRPPAPPPRHPHPRGTSVPPRTPYRPDARMQASNQNPMHQSPARPAPPSRPVCPTAPRAGAGCASSATLPRPPAPTDDCLAGHHAVTCNCR